MVQTRYFGIALAALALMVSYISIVQDGGSLSVIPAILGSVMPAVLGIRKAHYAAQRRRLAYAATFLAVGLGASTALVFLNRGLIGNVSGAAFAVLTLLALPVAWRAIRVSRYEPRKLLYAAYHQN